MRSIALVIVLVSALVAPAFAQKAEIEAMNAKWIDFFNKGDFAGVASLYTEDATAFPPGSGMVKGRAAIEALWKSMAEQVSDPKLTTLDVKPLGPSAAREIGTFSLKTKGSVTSFGTDPLVLRLKVPISRAAEGPSGLTSRVVSFGSLTCSAMLFHSASIAALPFTMPEPGGNAVASSV